MNMKNSITLIFCIILFGCQDKPSDKEFSTDAVHNSASMDNSNTSDAPNIQFEELEFDFGKIIQGEKVSHAFIFKNTGTKNLIISTAAGSCGCTVPEYPKEPVLPGESGKINVVFNSEGKSGYQEKTVTIVTNCEPATKILRIKTDIIVAETAK